MTDFIKERIEILEFLYKGHLHLAEPELSALRVLAQAEEALRMIKQDEAKGIFTLKETRRVIEKALAAIDALGQD